MSSLWERLFGGEEKPKPVIITTAHTIGIPLSDAGLAYLQRLLSLNEGKRLKVYRDTKGLRTIGIGHNIDGKGIPVAVCAVAKSYNLDPHVEINEPLCKMLFEMDVQDAVKECDANFPWWREHDESRKIAFLDLDFNMGPGTLAKFVNTLAKWRSKDYEGAARGLESSAWYTQVGNRGPRIVGIVRSGTLPQV